MNAVVGMLLLTAFVLWQEHGLVLKERQAGVRQAVETAYGVLEFYQSQVLNNQMSLSDAQQRAKSAVRGMRYGEGEYFWLQDMTPKMIMHPINPALDSTDISDNRDPKGKRLFLDMVDTVQKNGAGFELYMWSRPGNGVPVQKISYVKGFTPWGWIIGSGVYLDTVTAAVWQQAKYALLIAIVISAVLLATGLVIARSVARPIKQAVTIAQQVALGNLTSTINVTTKDETGQLMQALKDMNATLVQIVGDVQRGANNIVTASSEIAAGNLDLSSRTEEQAGSLEQTASAMEQLTVTVKQNADNAHQANLLARSASDIAVKGGQIVLKVVTTMDAISTSSRKVSDITSVIDSIAFQTNILALNAAVEAARAGEHGRGFAVVATEVRNLAQRSATAAKEIKALIAASAVTVDTGSELVQEAGTTMEQVVTSINKVNDIINDITTASREQSVGIAEVNHAILEMDQVTQQNAALVEQAAAAAHSLHDEANALTQTVSVFRLGSSLERESNQAHATTPFRSDLFTEKLPALLSS